jgi:hypothetical protein
MEHVKERLRYLLISGPDDAEFSGRVSSAIDEGYELYGSPAVTHDGTRTIVAQALTLPAYAAGRWK